MPNVNKTGFRTVNGIKELFYATLSVFAGIILFQMIRSRGETTAQVPRL